MKIINSLQSYKLDIIISENNPTVSRPENCGEKSGD